MTDESTWGHDSSQMHIPGLDLGVGLLYLLVSISVVLYVNDSVMRALIGLPLVVFVPGYALLVALYPHRHVVTEHVDGWFVNGDVDAPVPANTHVTERGLSLGSRLALSFGLSLALLAPLAIVISLLGFTFSLETMLGSLAVFATLALLVGSVRRRSIAPEDRFSLPLDAWFSHVSSSIFDADTKFDTVLNLALTAAVIIAMSGFAYALFVPNYGEQYTEFSLGTQTAEGQFELAGYPTQFEQGVPQELVVAIGNQEGANARYTVVVELQRVETVDGALTVVEREELTRFAGSVADDQTLYQPHELTPTMTGEDLRLSYMLYKGDAPADPTAENAYRHLFIWVTVDESA
ncbi:DUF1616 domain-containing protein [Haladaptatus sp. DYSN1]|uniref:DUF1616 domain-containing protein n=1 Tax=unclassified Haladaptatus TaxID=2622732 RepID=UPI00240633DE|nr:DUF1616 domain-containing protein [Haladaptatus sp. DYSN1]